MYIARVLYPVKVLGPGERLGIWLSGCVHHCPNCSNPELWEQRDEQNISCENIYKLIKDIFLKSPISGITFTGGDPFEQPKELASLIKLCSDFCDDFLVYTGYIYEELVNRNDPDINYILSTISLLIDGRYVDELNDGTFLAGSSNQRKIILNNKYRLLYTQYLENGKNEVQNFQTSDGFISVGIHKPGYKAEVEERLKRRLKNGI